MEGNIRCFLALLMSHYLSLWVCDIFEPFCGWKPRFLREIQVCRPARPVAKAIPGRGSGDLPSNRISSLTKASIATAAESISPVISAQRFTSSVQIAKRRRALFPDNFAASSPIPFSVSFLAHSWANGKWIKRERIASFFHDCLLKR
jgi:hypothetical protein